MARNAKNINWERFKEICLYHRIVEWDKKKNYIILDNGAKITIECTESDCCAWAAGEFEEVQLDAAITFIGEPVYSKWNDGDTYGHTCEIRFLHNQNLICKVNANADVGNGGYYYSVASFVVNFDNGWEEQCPFLSDTGDERE